MIFEKSTLWQSTLAERANDEHEEHRKTLRDAYLDLRENAARLVGSISGDLRDYTIHDVTHLDALWGIGSEIVGDQYKLTPIEGFVLGCAYLLHDAGMCVAAYPGGLSEIYSSSEWPIAVRKFTANEQNPTDEEKRLAVAEFLRMQHAFKAAELLTSSWPLNGTEFYLMEKADLRLKFGQFIGEVAASHWWNHEKLRQNLDRVVPSLAPFPSEWNLDLLKIALVLRVSDAAHIDERRAPNFVFALRSSDMENESRLHWIFQNRLTQPARRDDSIYYSSTARFGPDEVDSWWLAYDTLRMIDGELRSADSILADLRGDNARFSGRRIANVDSPTAMMSTIQVSDWIPIDTTIRISDVRQLIKSLGGEALYGRNVKAPLRELVQNAADAVRLRGTFHPEYLSKAEVKIELGEVDGRSYLEVTDNGIGMDKDILTGCFLDFGRTGWLNDPLFRDNPQINPRKIKTIGKFGIGFFSTLMLGDEIQVTTRRFNSAFSDTCVLTFFDGLSRRPILRSAKQPEVLTEGGTKIRIWLRNSVSSARELFGVLDENKGELLDICGALFPALDVSLNLNDFGKHSVLDSRSWRTIPAVELLSRIARKALSATDLELAGNIRSVEADDGEIIGRMLVVPREHRREYALEGAITSRGIRVYGTTGLAGLLEGEIGNAARDFAIPNIRSRGFKNWLAEQEKILANMHLSSEVEEDCASTIVVLGHKPKILKICETSSGWKTYESLSDYFESVEEVYVVHDASVSLARTYGTAKNLTNGTISVSMGMPGIFQSGRDDWRLWQELYAGDHFNRTLENLVLESMCSVWNLEAEFLPYFYKNHVRNGVGVYEASVPILQASDGAISYSSGIVFRKGMKMNDLGSLKPTS